MFDCFQESQTGQVELSSRKVRLGFEEGMKQFFIETTEKSVSLQQERDDGNNDSVKIHHSSLMTLAFSD